MQFAVFAYALVWQENGNNQSRAENHHLGKARNERYVSTSPILSRFNNSELRLQITSAKGEHKGSGDQKCYGPNFTMKFVSPTKVAKHLHALVCNRSW
jgi:hypothetical protein